MGREETPPKRRLDFLGWTSKLAERLASFGEEGRACDRLDRDGCELLSVCFLLWHYCECPDTRTTAGGFTKHAQELKKFSKRVGTFAAEIEMFNRRLALPVNVDHPNDPVYHWFQNTMHLPQLLRLYADFLGDRLGKDLGRYGNKRKWRRTDRLVMMACYVSAISGHPHYADLTHLLHAGFATSGREREFDESFIKNTLREYPETNALLDRFIKWRCAEYARCP